MLTAISEVQIRKKYSSKNLQISRKIRSSHRKGFAKVGVLKSFTNFTVLEALFNKAQTKGLLLYQKQLQHWCFPVKFTNLLEPPILKNICEQLLLWKLLCWR